MAGPGASTTMSASVHPPSTLTWLPRERRAVLVADMVESVRLIGQFQDDVIDRWRRFVHQVQQQLLPPHGGRMVKHLGDGMLLEFKAVPEAVAAALQLHGLIAQVNQGVPPERAIRLRAAIHVDDVVVDELDLFGAGVNVAARLATLAQPGGIVLSAEARDEVLPFVDAAIEDLGDCWLKHIDTPVRAFALSPLPDDPLAHQATPRMSPLLSDPLTASIAVVPLVCHAADTTSAVIGDLVADGVIAQLSRTPELRVLSRLATASLRGRDLRQLDIGRRLGTRFVLSGSFAAIGRRVQLTVELAETRGWTVLWADRMACDIGALLEQPSEPLHAVAHHAHMAILQQEVRRVSTQPLATLDSYSLLYGGIGLLHRSSAADMQRAREVLTALAEREPRHAAAHAWLAKWHCLQIIRGHASFAGPEGSQAQWHVRQALERDPGSALGWALSALVTSWVDKSLDATDEACSQSLALNPNESLGWLFTAALRSWQGQGAEAAAAADRALELSVSDPMRYYFETLAAAGTLADGQLERTIELCERSLRTNRLHTPTHRVLAIAQVMAGRTDAARATVRAMLQLQPGYTLARYRAGYPGGDVPHARAYAEALREAGVPA